MAVKGSAAKRLIFDTLTEVFGDAVAGENDGKLYLNLKEDGGVVQICVSLTCPKTPYARTANPLVEKAITPEQKEDTLTETEMDNIRDMMARLGL